MAVVLLGACTPNVVDSDAGPKDGAADENRAIDAGAPDGAASTPDGTSPSDGASALDGASMPDGASTPDGAAPSDGAVMDSPVTCTSGGQTWLYGEYFFDGCNTCQCTTTGGVICTARACSGDGGTPMFSPADAGMCAPETRRLQVIEHEVRYPCGIPGGPVGIRDARCNSLCQPANQPPALSWDCGRTSDPLVVFCVRRG